MDPGRLLDLYRSDLRGVLQGLIAATVIFGIAFGQASARLWRLKRALRRALWRSGRRHRRWLAARAKARELAGELAESQKTLAATSIELRRMTAIRKKLEREMGPKNEEIDRLTLELRWAQAMIPEPPVLTQVVEHVDVVL